MVTELSLAVRLNENGIAAFERRGIPGCANAAKLDAPDWYTLWKCVHGNHDNWYWSRAANTDLVSVSAVGVRREGKRNLAAGVRDLAKVVSSLQSGYPLVVFGRTDRDEGVARIPGRERWE